jgi:hypothetical protein
LITRNNKYLKLLLRLCNIFLIIALLDFIIGNLLSYFYFKQIAGESYRTTYAMDSTKADILVFGSSRANHHYVPEMFEDSLNMQFYNTGRDGNFLLYNYAVFKVIVARYTPKIIIFDVSSDELYYRSNDYEKLTSILPYYKNHPEIRCIVNLRSNFENYKLKSSIYPYNSLILTIAIGNMERNKARKSDIKGYIPLKTFISDTITKKTINLNEIIDTNKVKFIKDIISYCCNRNIHLFFIQSPSLMRIKESCDSQNIKKIAKENDVPFWDFSYNPSFRKFPAYFYDKNHLNETGANLFSKTIASRINKTFKN